MRGIKHLSGGKYKRAKPWQTRIYFEGTPLHPGTYSTEDEAYARISSLRMEKGRFLKAVADQDVPNREALIREYCPTLGPLLDATRAGTRRRAKAPLPDCLK